MEQNFFDIEAREMRKIAAHKSQALVEGGLLVTQYVPPIVLAAANHAVAFWGTREADPSAARYHPDHQDKYATVDTDKVHVVLYVPLVEMVRDELIDALIAAGFTNRGPHITTNYNRKKVGRYYVSWQWRGVQDPNTWDYNCISIDFYQDTEGETAIGELRTKRVEITYDNWTLEKVKPEVVA